MRKFVTLHALAIAALLLAIACGGGGGGEDAASGEVIRGFGL